MCVQCLHKIVCPSANGWLSCLEWDTKAQSCKGAIKRTQGVWFHEVSLGCRTGLAKVSGWLEGSNRKPCFLTGLPTILGDPRTCWDMRMEHFKRSVVNKQHSSMKMGPAISLGFQLLSWHLAKHLVSGQLGQMVNEEHSSHCYHKSQFSPPSSSV